MGTKRVGLARIEALMENLKREVLGFNVETTANSAFDDFHREEKDAGRPLKCGPHMVTLSGLVCRAGRAGFQTDAYQKRPVPVFGEV